MAEELLMSDSVIKVSESRKALYTFSYSSNIKSPVVFYISTILIAFLICCFRYMGLCECLLNCT